jgi:hypothetical protein
MMVLVQIKTTTKTAQAIRCYNAGNHKISHVNWSRTRWELHGWAA